MKRKAKKGGPWSMSILRNLRQASKKEMVGRLQMSLETSKTSSRDLNKKCLLNSKKGHPKLTSRPDMDASCGSHLETCTFSVGSRVTRFRISKYTIHSDQASKIVCFLRQSHLFIDGIGSFILTNKNINSLSIDLRDQKTLFKVLA